MRVRDLIYTYKNKLDKLERAVKDYYDNHYCGYMGEWMAGGSQEEYNILKQNVQDYLDSEIEV